MDPIMLIHAVTLRQIHSKKLTSAWVIPRRLFHLTGQVHLVVISRLKFNRASIVGRAKRRPVNLDLYCEAWDE